MNDLVKKAHSHPALGQNPAEPMGNTTKSMIEDGVEKNDDELTDPLSSDTESS